MKKDVVKAEIEKRMITVIGAYDQEPHIVEIDHGQYRLRFQVDLTPVPLNLLDWESIKTLRELSESLFLYFDKRPSDKIADVTVRRRAQRILAFAELVNNFKDELTEEFSRSEYRTRARDFLKMKLGEAYTLTETKPEKDETQEIKEIRREIRRGFSALAERSKDFKEALVEFKKRPVYRTKGRADTDAGRFVNVPDRLANRTRDEYTGALWPYSPQSNMFLGVYKYRENDKDNLELDDDGKLSTAPALEILTNEGANRELHKLDLPFLEVFFAAIYDAMRKADFRNYKEVIGFYAPEILVKIRGKRVKDGKKAESGTTDEDVQGLISKILTFRDIVGVIVESSGRRSVYPLLNFSGYDAEQNIISVQSPYICRIARDVRRDSIKKDKKGKPVLEGGKEVYDPHVTRLIHTSIESEKNILAVGIVYRCVEVIERTGTRPGDIPHISASTLIERVSGFEDRLESQQNKRRLLQRVFTKAWDLLETKTDLQKKYEGIVLPKPYLDKEKKRVNPECIPNVQTLQTMVFEFPHKGIRKDWKK